MLGFSTRTAKWFCAGLDPLGDIEHEGRFAALMASYRHAVEPDLGQVVHLPEPQEIPVAGVRIRRGDEIAPIPGHAVIGGKRLLNDPRRLGRLRLRARRFEPLLIAPDIVGIGGQSPAIPVKRYNGVHGLADRATARRCRGIPGGRDHSIRRQKEGRHGERERKCKPAGQRGFHL